MALRVGAQAEDFAYAYLQRQGLHLVARNYRCRMGEIDLILQENQSLVFVEVRYRKAGGQTSSVESIDYFKRQRLIKTASYYLQTHRLYDALACRFDVVAVTSEGDNFKLEWLKDAFRLS
jgi:putative endonuclease